MAVMNFSDKNRLSLRLVLLLIGILIFTGCNEALYSYLDEKDANEIMAALLHEQISCEKKMGDEDHWSILVDENDFANAMTIMKKYGLPKEKFKSIGDIFEKSGIISSPSEERIRFIHALSQEVSETISKIDGVVTARVQIVLPENNPFKESGVPSSASVFIKYRKDIDIAPQVIKIKEFVVKSIEGLTFENVTVALFPEETQMSEKASVRFVTVCGLRIASESAAMAKKIIGLFFTCIISLSVFLVYRFVSGKELKKRVIEFNHQFKKKMESR